MSFVKNEDPLAIERVDSQEGPVQEEPSVFYPEAIPRCLHAGTCGGCAWQSIAYSAQLARKQEKVEQLFASSLAVGAELRPIIPCVNPWHYRNKMEFSFSQDRAGTRYLGLMMRGRGGRVLGLKECHITNPWMIEALEVMRAWWEEAKVLAYHPYRNTGALRTLTLREGMRTGDKMAILTVSGHPDYALPKKVIDRWCERLGNRFNGISCFLRVQQAAKGFATQFYEWHLAGKDHIKEILHLTVAGKEIDLKIHISPSAFFQPNTIQAERLYSEAINILDPSNQDHVIDLYAGTATIGMAVSSVARKVTSIELNPYAILDAEENLSLNQIKNIELIQADATEALAALANNPSSEFPSAIVVDPPRSGLGPKAIQPILSLRPKKILYISCNPETQALDCEMLVQHGYQVETLQPIDQFPQTPHLENIALLRLLSESL